VTGVKKLNLVVLVAVLAGICPAQRTTRTQPAFDLSKIGFIVDGKQICEDKGRLQDYPSKVMDEIIAAGLKSVPVLIGMITNSREVRTQEPIICYWYGMTVGDLAALTLTDLFTDASHEKETIPGADWASIMDPEDKDRPAADQFHLFVKRHGRATLRAKWRQLWAQYGDQVYWDGKERCFRLKGQ
jgi:hypothetical protein